MRPMIRLVDSRATVRFLQDARPISRVERLGRYLDTREGSAAFVATVLCVVVVVVVACVARGSR